MNQDEFENQYPDFRADFGYRGPVKLPPPLNPGEILGQMLSGGLAAKDAAAISVEFMQVESYFVQLSWKSLVIGTFPCTQEQYDQSIVPDEAIAAAQSYQAPGA